MFCCLSLITLSMILFLFIILLSNENEIARGHFIAGAIETFVNPGIVPSNPSGGGWVTFTSKESLKDDLWFVNATFTTEKLATWMKQNTHYAQTLVPFVTPPSPRPEVVEYEFVEPQLSFVKASMYSYDAIYYSPVVKQGKAGQYLGIDRDGPDWMRLTQPFGVVKGSCPDGYRIADDKWEYLGADKAVKYRGMWCVSTSDPPTYVPREDIKTYRVWNKTRLACPEGYADGMKDPAIYTMDRYSDEKPCYDKTAVDLGDWDALTGAGAWAAYEEIPIDVTPDNGHDTLVSRLWPDGDEVERVDIDWKNGDRDMVVGETVGCPGVFGIAGLDPRDWGDTAYVYVDIERFKRKYGYVPKDWDPNRPCMKKRIYDTAGLPLTKFNLENGYGEDPFMPLGTITLYEPMTEGALNYDRAYSSSQYSTHLNYVYKHQGTIHDLSTIPSEDFEEVTSNPIPATLWTFDPDVGLYTGTYRDNIVCDPDDWWCSTEYINGRYQDWEWDFDRPNHFPYSDWVAPYFDIPVRFPSQYEDLGDEKWFGDDNEIETLLANVDGIGRYSEKFARYPVVGMTDFTLEIKQTPYNRRYIVITPYDQVELTAEQRRANAMAMNHGSNELLFPEVTPSTDLARQWKLSTHYEIESGTEMVELTIELPLIFANMEKIAEQQYLCKHNKLAPEMCGPNILPDITVPLLMVEVFDDRGQPNPFDPQYRSGAYFLDDLVPDIANASLTNPYNRQQTIIYQTFGAAMREEDHSWKGTIKRNTNLIMGAFFIAVGLFTSWAGAGLPMVALGTVMLADWTVQRMTGQSLFYHLGGITGTIVAKIHNIRHPDDYWEEDMNIMTMTGNHVIDTIIGTAFAVAMTFLLAAGVAAGLGAMAGEIGASGFTVAGKGLQAGEELAIGMGRGASMAVRHLMGNMFLGELFEEIVYNTFPGLILYKLGDEKNNVRLQELGTMVGDLSLSFWIGGIDIKLAGKGGDLKAFGVDASDVGLGKSRIQFGVFQRGYDLYKNLRVEQSVDISGLSYAEVQLKAFQYKLDKHTVTNVDFDTGKMSVIRTRPLTKAEKFAPVNAILMDIAQFVVYSAPAVVEVVEGE